MNRLGRWPTSGGYVKLIPEALVAKDLIRFVDNCKRLRKETEETLNSDDSYITKKHWFFMDERDWEKCFEETGLPKEYFYPWHGGKHTYRVIHGSQFYGLRRIVNLLKASTTPYLSEDLVEAWLDFKEFRLKKICEGNDFLFNNQED